MYSSIAYSLVFLLFFKQKTAYEMRISDWSSDVCSSDLKLDSELASACMSINAVKGVEIGDGFAAAALTGEGNADPMRPGADGPAFLANHAGGLAGGISTGQPVRSEEHTSELQSLMRISYAVICLNKKIPNQLFHIT